MDKPRKQRPLTVFKKVDHRGVKHDVDAKVYECNPLSTPCELQEVTCSSERPPRKWEVGKFKDC
ncbi:hypothetical protein ACNVJQ_002223 [Vibrio harveyi]|uniref:hypothetical protein n=1 Tax=Vibrio parahaemolyticus TaxID=670 RepID=UPI00111E81AD|nr:hypothetical protein [Vibrio parahaemolyticus]TPA28461.1 hypothetical protein DXJ84_08790 [Vibrio parahaemolyticus]